KTRVITGTSLIACLLLSCDSPRGSSGTAAGDLDVTTANEPPGENCSAGGTRIDITNDDDVTSTVYVCDGLDGDSISVEDAGEQCPGGGAALQIGDSEPLFVCNGKDGESADTVVLAAVDPGDDCTYGGLSLRIGQGEPIFVCHGTPGASGVN